MSVDPSVRHRARAVHSQLAMADIVEVVRAEYAMVDPRCSVLHFGVNDTYRVEAGGVTSVFRVYRAGRRSFDDVRAELSLLDDLSDSGVHVAAARPTCAGPGAEIVVVDAPDGLRPAVLFPFIGERDLLPTAEDASRFGTEVGRLHRAVEERSLGGRTSVTYNVAALLADPVARIDHAFGHRPDAVRAITSVADDLRQRLDSLAVVGRTFGAVHGDLQLKNARLGPDGHAYLVDFDECGVGWFVDDLATFVFTARVGKSADLEAAFLSAYDSTRPLSEDDRALIDVFVRVRTIFFLGWQLRLAEGWGPAGWLGDDWLDWNLTFLTESA